MKIHYKKVNRKVVHDVVFDVDGITKEMFERAYNKERDKKLIFFMRNCLRRVLKPFEYLYTVSNDVWLCLGYTTEDLTLHIESLFDDGMSWDNYGLWVIDHILPISRLLAMGERDPKVINSLSNLIPCWCSDNMKKGSKWIDDMKEEEFYTFLKEGVKEASF